MRRIAYGALLACLLVTLSGCSGGGGGGSSSTVRGPSLTGFSPASGAAAASVTLNGYNFDPVAANNTVKFNGVTAAISSASATQIVATVPAAATTGLISAANSAGTAYSTTSFTVITTLSAGPSVVSAVAGSAQNTISWSAVSGATSYNIYWSTTSGTGKSGTKIAGATSPYVQTGLTVGTPYYYVVTAANSAGESPASAQVSATPLPAAPTGVAAVGSNLQNTISWTASTGATSYNIYWSTTSGLGTSGTKIAGATSPYPHTGLTNGTVYYYVVTAVNSGGESAASAQVSATPVNTLPAAPSGVTATAGGAQNTISWSAVSGATSYKLYWSTTNGAGTGGTLIAGATSPYTHTPLTAGTPYYYVVSAVNSAGEGPASTQVNATPLATPPAAPGGVAAVAGNTQNTVTWTAVSGATSYNIYWSTTSGLGTSGTKITAATSPYSHTGRTNGTTYYYVVTAQNSAGESPASVQVGAIPTATPNSWAASTSIPGGQSDPVSGVISGILYVVGGNPPGGGSTAALLAYDPVANTWTSKAAMPTSRSWAGGAVINGKLYVVGGCAANSDCRIATTNILEVYDPVTNTWASKAPMSTARLGPAVAAINGILYVAGGGIACPPCGALDTIESYDPASNTWTTLATMPSAQAQAGAAVINGIFYSIGGYSWATSSYLSTVNAYDPAANTWSTKANMPTARNGTGTQAINGILYAVGGSNASGMLAVTEAYDPAANTWSTKAPMPTARFAMGSGVLNGRLYAVSGQSDTAGTITTVMEIYTP